MSGRKPAFTEVGDTEPVRVSQGKARCPHVELKSTLRTKTDVGGNLTVGLPSAAAAASMPAISCVSCVVAALLCCCG